MRSFKKIERFKVEKKAFKNWQKYCHIQSALIDMVANKKSDGENNITWKTPIYLCFRRNM
jgi:hypothetical protein